MIDNLTFFKTILFSLQNGKNISHALDSLILSASSNREKKIYLKINNSIRNGDKFSKALIDTRVFSEEIIQFVAMAERSALFHKSLEKIVYFLEVRENFYKESSDKVTLPFIYFFLATIVVLALEFFVVPYHIEQSLKYDAKIQELIHSHLEVAILLTNTLFATLLLCASYFFTVISALFSKSSTVHSFTKNIAIHLPLSSKIVLEFEKFMLLNMLSNLMGSGISFKISVEAARNSTTVKKYKHIFNKILSDLQIGKKRFYENSLFSDLEQKVLASVGSMQNLSKTFLDISESSKQNALYLSSKFFRLMVVTSIFLMAFAVFIEFFTIVLTQILIQKGMINAVDAARSGF